MKWVKITEEWFTGDHPNPLHPTGVVIGPRRKTVYVKRTGQMAGVGDHITVNDNGEAIRVLP